MVKALRIRVVGVVQGVGFRPFIYRLATSLNLKGYVVNLGGSEVEIHIEGEKIEDFMKRMKLEKPPQAKILKVIVEDVKPIGFDKFEIRESMRKATVRSMIPPDIAICKHCVEEVLNDNTRFHNYHWNSCAWCGPRFSMMYKIPYDRENTSMRVFKFCNECSHDYSNPNNIRRFHGQGISCPKCGPKTHVYDMDGLEVKVEDPLDFTAERILGGGILAVKGVGGYHIACLASRDDVVAELRFRKRRPMQPFALMARNYGVVEEIAIPPEGARELLESPQRPIVIMPRRSGAKVSELVAPGLNTIGVMLPYTAFQHLLLRRIPDGFLIMTSGNPRGKPMCRNLKQALRGLRGIVDYIIDHDREIVHRVDDSVIRFTDGETTFLRRGRGYAPEWIETGIELRDSIAVGAELQTAGAVGFEDKVIVTQYIGDIDEAAQLEELDGELSWLIETYHLNPEIIAMDMHPLYSNRKLAENMSKRFNAKLIEVQHHHAHSASIMAEYGFKVEDTVVAIAIDGTGYGDDGGIWGGEVLLATYTSYRRVGSLKPFHLPGGDTAATYPVKPLISLMASAGYSWDEVNNIIEERGLMNTLPHGVKEANMTYMMAKSGRGALVTSMGRTLDALSALLGACTLRTYEGEPPMKLESIADGGREVPYKPRIIDVDGISRVDTTDLLKWVINGLESGYDVRDLAKTVLVNLGRALGIITLKAIKGTKNIKQTVLASGGAAVNTHIIRGIKEALKEEGLEIRLPRKMPPGDGGVALGQLMIANCKLEYEGV